jgi:hypothetical protein
MNNPRTLNLRDFQDSFEDTFREVDLRCDHRGNVFAAVSDGGCLNDLRLIEQFHCDERSEECYSSEEEGL